MDATTSPMPERRGVDFLWAADQEWWGIQRKTISDLWASIEDGRLAFELAQISTEIVHCIFIIEGKLMATLDGIFSVGRQQRSVATHYKALMTLAGKGCIVLNTESAQHTGLAIKGIVDWSRESKHALGNVRPKVTGKWGKATSREWGVHLLQGFDGIGYDTANNIVEMFGVPLAWTVDEQQLMSVPGVGKLRGRKLIEALS